MYNVSDAYKKAIKAQTRKSTITGTLTTTSGKVYPLNDSVFVKESFYTTNRCVNNSALEFGSVYAGECGFQLVSNIDRYTLFGAEIKAQHNLVLEDGSVESVPLGVYYVDTATRTGVIVNLTALDGMSKFDIKVDEDVAGYWIELVHYVAERAGVELAQTDEELLALHVNSAEMYTLRVERLDNYRDALAYLSMVVCGFATMDRDGKVKICTFGASVVDTNNSSNRMNGCTFDDYTSKYGSVTARFVAEENYYPYKSEIDDSTNTLMLDMGDIPIVGGLPEAKQKFLDNIMATLKDITYVPASLSIMSNPAYDLGDMLQCDEVNRSDDNIKTFIMCYKFEYRQKESIKSYGENPLLQSVSDSSKRDKESTEAQIATKDVVVLTYTNVRAYEIKQEIKQVIDFDYSTFKNCNPIFIATIPFELDVDALVEFHFYNAMVEIEDSMIVGHYEAGKNIATISFYDKSTENERRSLRVLMRVYADAESAKRKQDAKIATIYNFMDAVQAQNTEVVTTLADAKTVLPITTLTEPLEWEVVDTDKTEPVATIDKLAIKAMLYAQGINGETEWDGNLEFIETFELITPNRMTVEKFNEELTINQKIPIPNGFVENIGFIVPNRIKLME